MDGYPTPDDVRSTEDRAWDQLNMLARTTAGLLLDGSVDAATDYAQRTAAAKTWWREASQQRRDVARLGA